MFYLTFSEAVFDSKLNPVKGRSLHSSPYSIGDYVEALKLYEKYEGMDAVDSSWSFLLEFGSEPFEAYQLKPFSKIVTPGVEAVCEQGIFNMAFGKKSAEGIKLPIVRIPFTDFGHLEPSFFGKGSYESKLTDRTWSLLEYTKKMDEEFSDGYCAFFYAYDGKQIPFDLHMNNVRALCVAEKPLLDIITHDVTRFISSVDVAIMGLREAVFKRFQTGDIARVYNNGFEGRLEPV